MILHKEKKHFSGKSPCGNEKNCYTMGKGGKYMQNFPLFTTEFGVSSLVLKEIPYRKTAYITVREIQPDGFDAHLKECVDFCRLAGAEKVYATGHGALERYPLHTAVLKMSATAWVDREKLACLFPVTEATVERWRQYCNERMADVDNAATLEKRDEEEILKTGGAYFVHRDGRLLGIGWLNDCELLCVAAEPGMGETVMHTLMSLVEGDTMTLEVASTNHRAIRLYERLGFLKTGERSRWYRL